MGNFVKKSFPKSVLFLLVCEKAFIPPTLNGSENLKDVKKRQFSLVVNSVLSRESCADKTSKRRCQSQTRRKQLHNPQRKMLTWFVDCVTKNSYHLVYCMYEQ